MKKDKLGRIYLCEKCLKYEGLEPKYKNILYTMYDKCYKCGNNDILYNKTEVMLENKNIRLIFD
jgi:hypothetical protein